MEKLGIINFTGASGRAYTFNVYPADKEFKEKGAVYILTKRIVNADGSISHRKLFIGATDNLHDTIHRQQVHLTEDEANCVCTYWEESDRIRKQIEDDLIQNHHVPSLDEITH